MSASGYDDRLNGNARSCRLARFSRAAWYRRSRAPDQSALRLGMRDLAYARPPFAYRRLRVLLEGKDELALALLLGPTWLGGREGTAGAPANQLRDLSGAEYAEVVKILGLAGN